MTPYKFFLANAGYSYGRDETPMQGRRRCAQALARAERKAIADGCAYFWERDTDIDSSEWSDERPAWNTWNCRMFNADGRAVATLYGIDLGRDGDPFGHPYARVVQAELAQEHYDNA